MSRPPLEMADLVRSAGQTFVERSRHWITWQHQKVLLAIARCRTAVLGGHRDQCSHCGHSAISYNSCRNRHCPKCQGNARHRWLQARQRELLPTSYVHVVFTLPRVSRIFTRLGLVEKGASPDEVIQQGTKFATRQGTQ